MIRTLTWCVLAILGVGPGAAPARAGHGAPVTAPSVQAEQVERLLGNGPPVVLIDLPSC